MCQFSDLGNTTARTALSVPNTNCLASHHLRFVHRSSCVASASRVRGAESPKRPRSPCLPWAQICSFIRMTDGLQKCLRPCTIRTIHLIRRPCKRSIPVSIIAACRDLFLSDSTSPGTASSRPASLWGWRRWWHDRIRARCGKRTYHAVWPESWRGWMAADPECRYRMKVCHALSMMGELEYDSIACRLLR